LTHIKNNSAQIIGGKHRGRRFKFADAEGLRPTPNKVRETLFNWLQFEMANATFLDLFAGSGALSFEAISRGAKTVVSIEKDALSFKFLQENKRLLEMDNLTIFNRDAFDFLSEKKDAFDYILLDPPFDKGFLSKALSLIMENAFLAKGGKIYIESEFKITEDFLESGFIINKQKKSGMVHYCLIQ